MIYKLSLDAELYEKAKKNKESIIFVEKTNVNDIEYNGFKKGFFRTCVFKNIDNIDWPNIEFYYDSKKQYKGFDFLFNVTGWPVIHRRVMDRLKEIEVMGVEYYPIKLVDVKTKEINNDYVLIYIRNFIEAYDMEKSKYEYNEKYDFYNFLPHDIVMNQEVCCKYDFFRCKKFNVPIYISQRIRDEIVSNGWTGFLMAETR